MQIGPPEMCTILFLCRPEVPNDQQLLILHNLAEARTAKAELVFYDKASTKHVNSFGIYPQKEESGDTSALTGSKVARFQGELP